MLTKYWSLSQQGHLQSYSKSKAWQQSTLLYNDLLGVEQLDLMARGANLEWDEIYRSFNYIT